MTEPLEEITSLYPPCPPAIRGSGRTQWMIAMAARAIEQKTSNVVFLVGRNYEHASRHLWPRLATMLCSDGLSVTRNGRNCRASNGVRVVLCGSDLVDERTRGLRDYSVFSDHLAEGEE